MKTYLPQIERRILVRPNTGWGILNYDTDNAYPQRMLELVAASPTAKDCWNKRAKFIGGNGFAEKDLGKVIINGKGLTLSKLLKAVATDKALFTGFGLHINWNANYKIASVHYVKFEDIRMGDSDSAKYKGKYVLYKDWGRKTWRSIYTSKFDVLDPYNPDPAVIKQQVIDAGGWDQYKGQLFYFNPEVDDYPLIEADSVWEDFETEGGIKIFANREVTTGFLPSTIITQKARREEAENESADQDSKPYTNTPSSYEQVLGKFQGAKNAQKILHLEYENEEEKPEIHPYTIQNNDKLFEVTEKSVEARIIKGFSVPKALVSSDRNSGLNNNGAEKKEAIREFNDNTAPDRADLSEVFEEIFSHFYTPVNPANNWEILPIAEAVADDGVGVKAGPALIQLLTCQLPYDAKVATLQAAFGFSQEEAEGMAPKDPVQEVESINPNPDEQVLPDK